MHEAQISAQGMRLTSPGPRSKMTRTMSNKSTRMCVGVWLRASALLGIAVCSASTAEAKPTLKQIAAEGAQDGRAYAVALRKRGVTPDAVACAVGMAAEDERRPTYTQSEAEAYAKAYGNACIGRDVL